MHIGWGRCRLLKRDSLLLIGSDWSSQDNVTVTVTLMKWD
jgi:hypothetical protein